MPHLSKMEWDFEDQLQATSKQVINNGGTPEITYYVYNGGGQRVRKVTERQAAASETPTRMKERIYLGGFEIYREYDADGSTVSLARETLHLMDGQQRVALVETRTQGDDGSPARLVRYQHGNHLDSTSLELDEAGDIISYEEYYPYGSTSYQAVDKSIKAAAKRYRYTGKERDEETGLAYHSKRYLAPWLGRWSACDPAGLIDGTNLFSYSRNSPTVLIDSNGLFSWSDLQSTGTTIDDLRAIDDTPTTSETRGDQVPYSPEVQVQLNELQRQQQRYLREEALKVRPTELQAIQETADRVSLMAGLVPLPPAQVISVGADLVSLGVDATEGNYKTAAFGLTLILLPGPSPKAGLNATDELAEQFWTSAPDLSFRDPHWATFSRFGNEALRIDDAFWHAVPDHSPISLIPDVGWKSFEKGQETVHFKKHGAEFEGISQAAYKNLAKTLGSESPIFTLSAQVDQQVVKYDPFGNYLFAGHAGNRTILTFYRPDNRTYNAIDMTHVADPMGEAIDYAVKKTK